jgi:glucokinase
MKSKNKITTKKSVIAIDLGGTKISAAVIDYKGKIKHEIKEASYLAGGWSKLKLQIVDICERLIELHGDIYAIGIGSAGPLHAEKGILLDPTNFGWSSKIINLKSDLEKKLKLKVILENDAVAAILGERWMGSASESSMCITLGTGLGLGILVDDKVVRGRGGLHAEGGHLVLRPQDEFAHCECGVKGCAEGFLSGVNFAKWVARKTKEKDLSAKELTDLALSGDKRILAFFADYADLMAQYICSLVVLYYPREIIFSGSFSTAHPLFLDQVKDKVAESFKRQEKTHKIVPKLLISKMGNNSGMIGAGYLAYNHKHYFN